MGKLVALMVATTTGFMLWDGFVICLLWNMFMPRIFGLPSLTIPQAIGVSIVAGVITGTATKAALEDEEPLVTLVIHVALGLYVLVIGFVTQFFL